MFYVLIVRKEEEIHDHVFVSCEIVTWFWKVIFLKLEKNFLKKDKIQQLTGQFFKDLKGKGLCIIMRLAFCMRIYRLWNFIKEILFNDVSFSKPKLLKIVEQEARFNLALFGY